MSHVFRVSFLLFFSFLLNSCGNIKFLNTSRSDLYSPEFLKKIESIKLVYKNGNSKKAINELKALDKSQLRPTEVALSQNLIGVIYFSDESYDNAIENFNDALRNSSLDRKLNAQIYLNLAGSYYKKNNITLTTSTLDKIEFKELNGSDFQNFHKLNFTISKAQSRYQRAAESLIWLLSGKNKLVEVKEHEYFAHLESMFLNLEELNRYKVLENFESQESLIVGYLGILNARKLYYSNGKDKAEDQIDWVEDNFRTKYPELSSLIESFKSKLNDKRLVDSSVIGVMLPLSGEKQKFGERAMLGIDFALKEIEKKKNKKFKVIIRDTKGSSEIGAHFVRELAEKHKVGVIIGGLFSKEAGEQYLESKKQGIVFISLSEVYTPKALKSHLLIEVPGSVESQIDKLFKGDISQKLGKKGALLYPNDERGEAIVDEFWRKSKQLGIEVTDVLSYDTNQTDFRDEAKILLGLKFPRERQEEYELLKEIHSLEKKSSARRIQTLRPQVDFDWIYIPSYPDKAIQILPSFAYFDAFRINFVGTEAWRSKRLFNQFKRKGKLYFLTGDSDISFRKFQTNFSSKYSKRARIIESRSYESFSIASSLLSDLDDVSRTELDLSLKNKKRIRGISGIWNQHENVWIKELATMSYKSGRVGKAVFDEPKDEESQSEDNAGANKQ